MSKTIRVSDDVYQRLTALLCPQETYSQVIDRCMSAVEAIRRASKYTQGQTRVLVNREPPVKHD